MRRQDRAYRAHERLFVLMGVIALLDTVGAVGGPGQNRLIVLIDARGVGSDSDADPLQGRIEGYFCERLPRPL